jgi:hypothetical protein
MERKFKAVSREHLVAEPTLRRKHKWITRPGFRRYRCAHCGCKKYWDTAMGRIMFQDRHGNILYLTPNCHPDDAILKQS